MAYQIGFDLYESATQDFLQRVQRALRKTEPSTALETASSTAERYTTVHTVNAHSCADNKNVKKIYLFLMHDSFHKIVDFAVVCHQVATLI